MFLHEGFFPEGFFMGNVSGGRLFRHPNSSREISTAIKTIPTVLKSDAISAVWLSVIETKKTFA